MRDDREGRGAGTTGGNLAGPVSPLTDQTNKPAQKAGGRSSKAAQNAPSVEKTNAA